MGFIALIIEAIVDGVEAASMAATAAAEALSTMAASLYSAVSEIAIDAEMVGADAVELGADNEVDLAPELLEGTTEAGVSGARIGAIAGEESLEADSLWLDSSVDAFDSDAEGEAGEIDAALPKEVPPAYDGIASANRSLMNSKDWIRSFVENMKVSPAKELPPAYEDLPSSYEDLLTSDRSIIVNRMVTEEISSPFSENLLGNLKSAFNLGGNIEKSVGMDLEGAEEAGVDAGEQSITKLGEPLLKGDDWIRSFEEPIESWEADPVPEYEAVPDAVSEEALPAVDEAAATPGEVAPAEAVPELEMGEGVGAEEEATLLETASSEAEAAAEAEAEAATEAEAEAAAEEEAATLEREAELFEREPEIPEREAELFEREPEIPEREAELFEREPEIPEREAELFEREPEIPEREVETQPERDPETQPERDPETPRDREPETPRDREPETPRDREPETPRDREPETQLDREPEIPEREPDGPGDRTSGARKLQKPNPAKDAAKDGATKASRWKKELVTQFLMIGIPMGVQMGVEKIQMNAQEKLQKEQMIDEQISMNEMNKASMFTQGISALFSSFANK